MHDNEFTINIKTLEKRPVTLHVDCAPEAIELVDPEFRFSQIQGDVAFKLVRPRVLATGVLKTEAVAQCVRCLTEAIIPVSAAVNAAYENEDQTRDTRNEIVNPEDQVITTFHGDFIQPENELREAIMLELPLLPLCREDCKGLCDQCGANLNDGACSCDETDQDVSPWKTALKGLKLQDGE